MADLPIELGDSLNERLARCLDVEGKIPRALDALVPLAGLDVLLFGEAGGIRARQLAALGARLVVVPEGKPRAGADRVGGRRASDRPGSAVAPERAGAGSHLLDHQADHSVDVVVGMWTRFRDSAAEIAEAERVARPAGRLLVVHDYGRDDVSRLRGDLPEYGSWSDRRGPFLANGFRLHVIHCFWTFASIDDATEFLAASFGERGREVARSMSRPRLSYKVAIYHRTLGDPTPNGRLERRQNGGRA